MKALGAALSAAFALVSVTAMGADYPKRIKNGKIYLIAASNETRGHLTTGNAKFYAAQVEELLQTAPQNTM